MDKFNFLARVIKEVALQGLKYELDTDNGDLSFIEIYGKERYFGFYVSDEIEFFVHENINSDTRYIYKCDEYNVGYYIINAFENSKKFIKEHEKALIDKI